MTFIQIHSVQRPMINWKMITHSALEMIMENEKIIKTADSYIGGERDRESDTVNVYVWCRPGSNDSVQMTMSLIFGFCLEPFILINPHQNDRFRSFLNLSGQIKLVNQREHFMEVEHQIEFADITKKGIEQFDK